MQARVRPPRFAMSHESRAAEEEENFARARTTRGGLQRYTTAALISRRPKVEGVVARADVAERSEVCGCEKDAKAKKAGREGLPAVLRKERSALLPCED